ncbi:protein Njmu-R1-like isoform X1 [Haliotis rufescens]|uniref:protein Njmu-R1-like isoform X1 n=1 Tax=Haliotis rufescens TaxID=6454 RepID=UPI001EB09699|nr:protein Njmu-R1-like isoform X1 [Haliotis rufescens]
MADESDTGSIQSSQSEQGPEKKAFEDSRFYALYIFCPKRSRATGEDADSSSHSEDGNLSLTVAATNLSAAAETDLRKSLSQRLSKIPNNPNEGNFLSVGLSTSDELSNSAVCYYCVLNGGTAEVLKEETTLPGTQYVICFISFLDSSLDLFRPELDQYTTGIVKLLDAEPAAIRETSSKSANSDSAPHGQLSQIDGAVKDYLERWYEVVLEYLARCVAKLGSNVHYLIYAALLDAQLQMKGFTQQEEADINKFVKCCSLSSLVQQLQAEETPGKSDGDLLLNLDTTITSLQSVTAVLTAKDNTFMFEVDNFSSTCQFCKMATEHLMSGDPKNVTKIKETLESVKLAFIHNLNKLKRFLRQAETDHYALFRSLIYLKKSGAGDLLLRYVHLDASPDTLNVLTVLQDFIKSKGQALV